MLQSIDTTYKRCLIVFDDFHNLTDILENIKDFFLSPMPRKLKIFFVGRNDYSVGNAKYFNFLSFCENNKSQIKGYVLHCMDDNDTSDFIHNIIPNIPEIIFLKIKK